MLKTVKSFVDHELVNNKKLGKTKTKKKKPKIEEDDNNNVDEDNVTIGDILNSSINTSNKDKEENDDDNSILSNLSLSDINSQDSCNSEDSVLSFGKN